MSICAPDNPQNPDSSSASPLAHARRVLREEAEALLALADRLGETDALAKACEALRGCKGRVVVTGMGKSGLIGRKITATLASTGTPSLFLHPAEAVHGDLGMVASGDVVLALSYSGETDELRGGDMAQGGNLGNRTGLVAHPLPKMFHFQFTGATLHHC